MGNPGESNHDEAVNRVDEDAIYEDEIKQQQWEEKMIKLYEERTSGRTNILIHVAITAFSQTVLVVLLFMEVVGNNLPDIKENFGTLTDNVGIICARFICTIILHLSQQDEV